MIIGNGIDIIEIDRIRKAISKNQRFLDKIFIGEEKEYIQSRNENMNTIAGMFSAKEAVSKALGCGIRDFKWHDIQIYHDKLGKPFVGLTGEAREISERKEINHISISITHIDKYALAIAIAEGNKKFIETEIDYEKMEYMLVDRELIKDILPERRKTSHKGTYGKIGIIAGSIGMTGAAYLSSSAAIRSGGGLVYAVIPKSLNTIMEIKTTEVITKPIEDFGKGFFCLEGLDEVKKAINNLEVLALGPGIGVDKERIKIIEEILEYTDKTIVLDADGLNCIADSIEILRDRKGITIISPHPGELSRLLNVSVNEIQSNRIKYSKLTSEKFNVITVLKGVNTIVCGQNGEVYVNPTGNPGMATAGSGDVLTGMISSFIGQGIEPLKAAIGGVYLHGLAGDLAAVDKGEYGLIATDILENIPYAIKQLKIEN